MKLIETEDDTNEKELEITMRLNHENVIRYYDHFKFETNAKHFLALVIEYCEVIFILPIKRNFKIYSSI